MSDEAPHTTMLFGSSNSLAIILIKVFNFLSCRKDKVFPQNAQKKHKFWRFLWASILIGLSACLGNVVDAMIVGNLINEDAVSAINLALPLLQFMFTINMLLAAGGGMLVGMELGKNDTRRASRVVHGPLSSVISWALP